MPIEPQSPGQLAVAKAQDVALLEEDARRFLVRERPATDAIVLALLKPRNVILRRYRETLAAMDQAALGPALAFTDPTGRVFEGDGVSAAVALGETIVAKAILGDTAAAQLVVDRIEGKAGQRKGDDDGAYEKRAEMMKNLEDAVRLLNSKPVEVTVEPPHRNGHDRA